MTALIPGLENHLVSESNRIAGPRQRGRYRRRAKFVAATLIAGFSMSGAAYAARSLWLPALGSDQLGHATRAADRPPPADQLRLFEVLRRSATPDDRGAVTERMLTFADAKFEGVRTEFVRLLGHTSSNNAVVLVPVLRKAPELAADSPVDDGLCIFLESAEAARDAGTTRCATTKQVVSGELALSAGFSPSAADPRESGTYVGVVPDGVVSVTVGSGSSAITGRVANNAYIVDTDHFSPLAKVTWNH